MIDLALKDIRSHKLRSFLTALGIVIAITTVVSLGSISSGMESIIKGQLELVTGKLILQEAGQSSMGPPVGSKILMTEMNEIEQISGVESAAGIRFEMDSGKVVVGVQLDKMKLIGFEDLKVEDGDWPDAGEYGVMVGSKAREEGDYNMGDFIRVNDADLEVVGMLEEMGGTMDYGFMTSWETLNDIFPVDEEYVTIGFVKPQDLSMMGEIADKIKEDYPHLNVETSEGAAQKAEESLRTFKIITFGIGFVATIVAMFGIINTMLMSVSEKKKQIGVMKAIGASRRQIMIRFFEESIIMGLVGSAIGLFFGFMGTQAVNIQIGMPIAKVTPGLAVFSIFFAMAVTIAATLYPAKKAADTDPISAIRGAK